MCKLAAPVCIVLLCLAARGEAASSQAQEDEPYRQLVAATNALAAINSSAEPPSAAEAQAAVNLACDALKSVVNSKTFHPGVDRMFRSRRERQAYYDRLRGSLAAFIGEFVEPERALLARAELSEAARAQILAAAGAVQPLVGKETDKSLEVFFTNVSHLQATVCRIASEKQLENEKQISAARSRQVRAIALGVGAVTLVAVDAALGAPTAGWSGVSISAGFSILGTVITSTVLDEGGKNVGP
jgi:hypothetical protein